MSFQKTPGGTRGARGAPSNALTRRITQSQPRYERKTDRAIPVIRLTRAD